MTNCDPDGWPGPDGSRTLSGGGGDGRRCTGAAGVAINATGFTIGCSVSRLHFGFSTCTIQFFLYEWSKSAAHGFDERNVGSLPIT